MRRPGPQTARAEQTEQLGTPVVAVDAVVPNLPENDTTASARGEGVESAVDLAVTEKGIPSHPLAELFPLLEGQALQELAHDIAANGQLVPITQFEDRILDGRGRYRACQIAGVEPRVEVYVGDSPLAFVVSRNLHRRHLNESQRSLVAAKIASLKIGANQYSEGLPIGRAAAELKTSARSVARAKKVLHCGSPELLDAVQTGKLAVSAAAAISRLPKPEQKAALARPKRTARKRRTSHLPSETITPVDDAMIPTATADPQSLDDGGIPPFLDRRELSADHRAVYTALTARWNEATSLKVAWGRAPAVVRERFINTVLRSDMLVK